MRFTFKITTLLPIYIALDYVTSIGYLTPYIKLIVLPFVNGN
jgi:hypothetical protein